MSTETQYTLMNKDTLMLEFVCRRNDFDGPEFFERQWYTAYRPIGYRSLPAFLEKQKAPKHRKQIQKILE